MVQLYRRPDEYDLEHLGDDEDIQFYVSLARTLKPKSILELACGTGRITIPLAEEGARSGYSIVGLDTEPAMLKQAGQKVKRLPAAVRKRISLVKGDMRSWGRSQRFDLRDPMFVDKSCAGAAGSARDLGSRAQELVARRTVCG